MAVTKRVYLIFGGSLRESMADLKNVSVYPNTTFLYVYPINSCLYSSVGMIAKAKPAAVGQLHEEWPHFPSHSLCPLLHDSVFLSSSQHSLPQDFSEVSL